MPYSRLVTTLVCLVGLLIATSAEARHRHRHYTHQRVMVADYPAPYVDDRYPQILSQPMGRRPHTQAVRGYDMASAGSRPAGCPHRWCGCGTSLRVFGRIIPRYNLASNYGDFPPASPGPGMVAWRHGHVKVVTGGGPGNWTCYDPNSGHGQAHSGPCSLAGFHIVDPNGNRIASASGRHHHRRYASN